MDMHATIYTFNIFFIFAYIATKFGLQDTRLIPNVGMVRFLDEALKHKHTRFNEQKRKKKLLSTKNFFAFLLLCHFLIADLSHLFFAQSLQSIRVIGAYLIVCLPVIPINLNLSSY